MVAVNDRVSFWSSRFGDSEGVVTASRGPNSWLVAYDEGGLGTKYDWDLTVITPPVTESNEEVVTSQSYEVTVSGYDGVVKFDSLEEAGRDANRLKSYGLDPKIVQVTEKVVRTRVEIDSL